MLNRGVAVAHVIEALALLVVIGPDPVRVPAQAPTKNGHWDDPLHRRCPNRPAGSQWKTGDVKPN